jgi:tripartite ATP-independent transporter DctM subunit
MATTVLSLIFLFSISIGIPIAFGMGLAGVSWILFVEGLDASILARRMHTALSSFPLLAVPLFIMIGFLADRSGMLPDLVRWLQLLLGRFKGGMAYINVVGSMVFAGVSGSAVSDVASLGRVEIEMMRQAGYPLPYSAALTAVSSIIAPIIPPSVAMVIYALAIGNVSIGGLFMAGVVPGVLMGAGLLAICWYKARTGVYGTMVDRPGLGTLVRQTIHIMPLMLLPVLIVGGIVGGIFTVTESAAIGVGYTLVVGFGLTRQLRLKDLYDAAVYSAVVSSVLGMLIGAGAIVSWILTRNQVTQQLADYITTMTADPTLFMVVVAVALLLLGMVMDATALTIALAPLLAPIARIYGIDDLQFGVVFVLCTMIGLITPPVGIILAITATVARISFEAISRAIVPFVAWAIAVVALVVLVPPLTLALPRLVGF